MTYTVRYIVHKHAEHMSAKVKAHIFIHNTPQTSCDSSTAAAGAAPGGATGS
jgi:hypothetical protein